MEVTSKDIYLLAKAYESIINSTAGKNGFLSEGLKLQMNEALRVAFKRYSMDIKWKE